MGNIFIDIRTQQLIKTIKIENIDEEGIYCLLPLNKNLFICGSNLRTIDIYDVNDFEKVASRAVSDEFIFGIDSIEGGYFFCGSKNIFGYFLHELMDKKVENENEISQEEYSSYNS